MTDRTRNRLIGLTALALFGLTILLVLRGHADIATATLVGSALSTAHFRRAKGAVLTESADALEEEVTGDFSGVEDEVESTSLGQLIAEENARLGEEEPR